MAAKAGVNALIADRAPVFNRFAKRLADLAIQNRFPSMYAGIEYVEAGGLASYTPDDVLDAIRKGSRRQDPIDPHKYKYFYPVEDLPFGLKHIVVVVRIATRKFVLTAYGIERKGGR